MDVWVRREGGQLHVASGDAILEASLKEHGKCIVRPIASKRRIVAVRDDKGFLIEATAETTTENVTWSHGKPGT